MNALKKWSIKWFLTMILVIIATVLLFVGIALGTDFELADLPSIIILVEVMVGILVYDWIASRKIDARNKMKRQAIWISSLFVFVTVGLIILYIVELIKAAEIIEIIVLFGLVLVTALYATQTKTIAKETENQRYDAFRPVLDIHMNMKPVLVISTEPTTNTDDRPIEITYEINNIGVGPALDGHLLTPEPNRIDLGTLTTIRDSDAIGDYRRGHINIQKENLPATIIAYYKDVFSRSFKSEREICLAIEEKAVTFGTLKHRKLDREKDSDLIESIWSPFKEEVNQND